MRRDEPSPIYKVCPQCTEHVTLSPAEIGELRSRHFGVKIAEVTYGQMQNKTGDPEGWMEHVESSIVEAQNVHDPLALVSRDGELTLINGNHRAWIANRHRISARATVFTARCGRCTEALFEDSMNAWTRAIGWLHHQQGFVS